jgi:hypothetical protein
LAIRIYEGVAPEGVAAHARLREHNRANRKKRPGQLLDQHFGAIVGESVGGLPKFRDGDRFFARQEIICGFGFGVVVINIHEHFRQARKRATVNRALPSSGIDLT